MINTGNTEGLRCPRCFRKPLGTIQAEQIGLAVGTLVKNESQRNIKVVEGHDARVSGEVFKKALIHGLEIVDSNR